MKRIPQLLTTVLAVSFMSTVGYAQGISEESHEGQANHDRLAAHVETMGYNIEQNSMDHAVSKPQSESSLDN